MANKSETKKVQWRSPSNIALVKYWGKLPNQIPLNPSLSMTLANSYSETKIEYSKKSQSDCLITFEFRFEGKENGGFQNRIFNYLKSLIPQLPFLTEYFFSITSSNSFPHSAGIASSASAMSSLALCLTSIEYRINNCEMDDEFFIKASKLARLGSGSACRSVYGGFVSWGLSNVLPDSSNLVASQFNTDIAPIFQNLQDSILIIDKNPKKVGSSQGHQLMENHVYKKARIQQANQNYKLLFETIKSGDFEKFAAIVEAEALAIHALMLTSNPWYVLLKPNTFQVIEKIRDFREQSNIPVVFTIDAGPNVHVLYPEEVKDKVRLFINNELVLFCSEGKIIHDKQGGGPEEIGYYGKNL